MRCLVIVAHPDDEVIWMGGLILRRGDWEWHVLSLCRLGDPDREPRFHLAARELGVRESMSDLDDSPVLAPLSPDLGEIKERIRILLPASADLIFTHGSDGEYTYHLRHVEVSRAVAEMIGAGELIGTLVTFAYEDGGPAESAHIHTELTPEELARKRQIVRDIYGFAPGSLEFDSAGPVEACNVHPASMLAEVRAMLVEGTLSGRTRP